ncbi:MAG: response regulator [Ignavibacteriaceae bacterium]
MANVKILIVEDEAIVALEIEHRLRALGYEVCDSSATGEKAILLAEEHMPALILMDIKLKGKMNGIVAAKIIKERFNIPSIFVTANSDESTIRQIQESLNYEYLFKPFEEEDLIKAIEKTLN